jgi:hypothetical protein
VAVEREAVGASLSDVLDRVLDKGIVIGDRARLSLFDLLPVAASSQSGFEDEYDLVGINLLPGAASSQPAWEDDDDDDDDGGEGSSGAPAILERPMEPRRRPPSRPERTRRKSK